ncbi:MAG: hypothetical protein WC479_05785 [Candidatus Izemoplasmatales bacterium]
MELDNWQQTVDINQPKLKTIKVRQVFDYRKRTGIELICLNKTKDTLTKIAYHIREIKKLIPEVFDRKGTLNQMETLLVFIVWAIQEKEEREVIKNEK